ERILLVGTREWEHDEIRQRQHILGLHHLTPEDAADSPAPVLDWIRSTGASKLMVHFDLDALDPRDLFAAVAPVPHGLSLENVIELINAIADNFDLVALTIAEPMPTVAIRLRDMLSRLPLVR
ncbi:MAG: arginase family protein, partial [Muribaculaceae bacterium]|nr:arginase family protein [Muribaculaceae bacterium]